MIEPAQTEWLAPILLGPKKDGTLPFCVDYCMLDAVAIWDFYAIPCKNEYMDSVAEAMIF